MPRKSEEDFVLQALERIGLSDSTIGNFRDAGIVTASAMAQLEAAHFGALGVRKAEHRQQLFFLVQTFKKNVPVKRQSRRLQQKREEESASAFLGPSSESFELDEALQSSVDQSLDDDEEREEFSDAKDDDGDVELNMAGVSSAPAVSSPQDRLQEAVHDALSCDEIKHSVDVDEEFVSSKDGSDQQPVTTTSEISDQDDILLDDALRTPTPATKSHRKSYSWNGLDTSSSSEELSSAEGDDVQIKTASIKTDPSFDDEEVSVISSKSLPTRRSHTSKIPARQQTRIPQKHRRRTLMPTTRIAPPQESRVGKELSSIPADESLLMSPLQEVNLENPRARKNTVNRTTSSSSLGPKKTNWKELIQDLRIKNESAHDNHAMSLPEPSRIRVVVRKRPMVQRSSDNMDILQPLECCGHLIVYQPKTRVDLTRYVEESKFAFDQVFHEEHTNRDVYVRAVRDTVQDFLNEQWVTIACYGQTGAGKTHTMMGVPRDPDHMGLYAMAALDIFHVLPSDLDVHVSMFEIYNGKFWDILQEDRKKIQCLEDEKGQMNFRGLSEYSVGTKDDFLELIQSGIERRATGVTSRNADSSRSHAILQVHLVRSGTEVSRMTLLDLAGSERASDTTDKFTRAEGAEINTSLLALKEVIRALANNGSHVPFRLSPLTQVLKSAFVSSTTVFIACVAPDLKNCDPTMNTLRYADRIHQRNPDKIKRQPSNDSLASHPSLMLDDILASPKAQEHPLVVSHKEMLAAQLELLETELKLVDQVQNFDEYLARLESIHEEYFAVLELLRAQIRGDKGDEDSFEDLRD